MEHPPSELCVSSITLAELRFGAELKKSPKLRRAIRTFVKDVSVIAFDEGAAERFAEVASDLTESGPPIGAFDTLVAAQALALGLVVVHQQPPALRPGRGAQGRELALATARTPRTRRIARDFVMAKRLRRAVSVGGLLSEPMRGLVSRDG